MRGSQQTPVVSRLRCVPDVIGRKGVLDYTRGHVTIRDRAALERHACECYAQMEAQFEALHADYG
jgi:hypothetical protein